jgi:diguanylate cyclase (GGDEF)-like protein/PAS domain S-box-containing protein
MIGTHSTGSGASSHNRLLRRTHWLTWLWRAKPAATQPTAEDLVLYRVVTENVSDVIVRLDRQRRRTYVSPSCLEVLGYTQIEMLGGDAFALVHPDDLPGVLAIFAVFGPTCPVQEATWRIRRKDCSYIWVEARYRYLEEDGGLVVILRDVNRRKIAEERLADAMRRLEHLALRDALTGLPNRRHVTDTIGTKLAANDDFAVMFVDLNDFKPINDRHGHDFGDAVLVGVARRLAVLFGDDVLVGRLGGDEFAVLLDAHGGVDSVAVVARKIVEAVSEPLMVGDRVLKVSASVGIALSPRDGTETSALLRCADLAMYHAKRKPTGCFEFYIPRVTTGAGRTAFDPATS